MTKMPKNLKITKIPLNLKNDQNIFEIYKMTEILLKLKMTKIPHKPKKWLKYSQHLKNDWNTPET